MSDFMLKNEVRHVVIYQFSLELEYIRDMFAQSMQVSNIKIWCECFGRRKEDLHPKDSYAVAAIMKHFPEWKKGDIAALPIYRRQRVYTRNTDPE